ncbi:hypothetical protein DOY81_003747 [Sarcophaga bullata]|nr:hypothetical protein DOY81_003747 [Sarcophaga bullata]
MKTIVVLLAVIAACAAVPAHNNYGNGNNDDKNGKGSSVITAPPCPKNYLFSCQPNLAPVPCSSSPSGGSVGGYGCKGAHSEYVPAIAIDPQNYHGLTQNLLQYPNYYHHHH